MGPPAGMLGLLLRAWNARNDGMVRPHALDNTVLILDITFSTCAIASCPAKLASAAPSAPGEFAARREPMRLPAKLPPPGPPPGPPPPPSGFSAKEC